MTLICPAWEVRDLRDLVDILDAKRIPLSAKERADRPGSVPYYGAAGQVGWIDVSLFDEPLILLGEDGVQFFDPSKRKSYLVDGPAWVNNHAHVLRVRESIDRRFLNYYLNHADYRGFANGTTRLKLTQAAMRRIPVPVPPLDEQRRIVDLLEDHLSHLDAAEVLLANSVKRLVSMRQAILAEAMSRAAGGQVINVGELATVTTGMTPLKSNKSFYEGGTIPWVTSGDLHQGIIQRATQFVTERALEETSLKMIPAGSILLAMYGEGKTRGTAAELGIDATVNQACAAVILNDPDLKAWVRLVLDAYYDAMRRMAAGGVQPNLNLSLVRAIKIPMPPQSDRDALVLRLNECEEHAKGLEKAIGANVSRASALRRSLLAAAFTGRLTAATPTKDLVSP